MVGGMVRPLPTGLRGSLLLLALVSCGRPSPVSDPAQAPTSASALASAAGASGSIAPPASAPAGPSFELGREAITFVENNPWHAVELEVTVSNPTDQPVEITPEHLLASGADGLMGQPSWSPAAPRQLGPGAKARHRVGWGYPSHMKHTSPTSITVVYRQHGTIEMLRRVVPVRVLHTEGVTFAVKGPARARAYVAPVPDKAKGWDVDVLVIGTNASPETIIYAPCFNVAVVEPPGGTASS